ncbi:MAG: DNA-methyltransferase [Candidatus Hodarchaeota archaeon]
MTEKKNRGTKTSSFGVSKRESHDSSKFYASKLYQQLKNKEDEDPSFSENPIDPKILNTIHCMDSRSLSNLPDSSIHLAITSPPYNVAKEYDDDLSLSEYLNLLQDVFLEVYRVLVTGGRVCINVANIGRKPYIPLHSYIIQIMHKIGFLMRGEIVWNKAASAGSSTAWGSWLSSSNPALRDVHEYILAFSKGSYKRPKESKEDTISRDEFLEFTKSIWEFPTESAKRIGHPAPFPVELPYRLIQLYSFKGDIILDPFCGSGTTCIAALKAQRRFIGYDIDENYVELARKRIQDFRRQRPLDQFFNVLS